MSGQTVMNICQDHILFRLKAPVEQPSGYPKTYKVQYFIIQREVSVHVTKPNAAGCRAKRNYAITPGGAEKHKGRSE